MRRKSKHYGQPDSETLEYNAGRAASAAAQGMRHAAPVMATERNKARCRGDSQRAMFHSTVDCPVCDPEGYATYAAKHKAREGTGDG